MLMPDDTEVRLYAKWTSKTRENFRISRDSLLEVT